MDKFYVYRPMLDLIGQTEGTAKHDGYNTTLGYGIMLDGKVSKGKGQKIVLTNKTLAEIDKIQTQMLKDPDNKKLKSSALGMYQEIRTTIREIKKAIGQPDTDLFNAETQDNHGAYLLGVRGIDKYFAGRLKEDTLINNLAKEWASLPTTAGKGFYAGQHAAVGPEVVRKALQECLRRHKAGQPKEEVEVKVPVPVPTEQPTVPKEVDKSVRHKFNWLTSIFGAGSVGGTAIAWLKDADWQTISIVLGGGIAAAVLTLLIGEWAVRRIKAIRTAVEG